MLFEWSGEYIGVWLVDWCHVSGVVCGVSSDASSGVSSDVSSGVSSDVSSDVQSGFVD